MAIQPASFGLMANRVARELRRTNIDEQIKDCINDAIFEAASFRFYFNEVKSLTFNTVIGQEYYPDMSVTEVDLIYYYVNSGPVRYEVFEKSDDELAQLSMNGVANGQLTAYSRTGVSLRFWPIPSKVFPIYIDGASRLTPWPLVSDEDTNLWFTEGERYIRALAKRNVLRDVVKDINAAMVMEATADDYRSDLTTATTLRLSTGTLRPTQF